MIELPDVGTDVAGFRLVREVGRGAGGAVFVADQVRLGRRVALKVLLPHQLVDDRGRERFQQESALAASLDHPHIVPIHDAGEAGGWLYIAMKLVDGADLGTVLEDGPLDPARAVAMVAQVASALDAAHGAGLVHRDVKPANVLVERRTGGHDHCYLADFGLVKQVAGGAGLTGTGFLLGTPGYLSPEQALQRPVDLRTDVYALGCLLFECLTGRLPFECDTHLALLNAHVDEPPPSATALRPGLPAGFDEVMTRAMAKAPADRYQSCGDLARAAAEVLSAVTPASPARPAPPVAPVPESPAPPAPAAPPSPESPEPPAPAVRPPAPTPPA
ncbi:MAG: serine/threonine-protein kinase, partial [Acidimicrobiales bacterium]